MKKNFQLLFIIRKQRQLTNKLFKLTKLDNGPTKSTFNASSITMEQTKNIFFGFSPFFWTNTILHSLCLAFKSRKKSDLEVFRMPESRKIFVDSFSGLSMLLCYWWARSDYYETTFRLFSMTFDFILKNLHVTRKCWNPKPRKMWAFWTGNVEQLINHQACSMSWRAEENIRRVKF